MGAGSASYKSMALGSQEVVEGQNSRVLVVVNLVVLVLEQEKREESRHDELGVKVL